MEFEGFNIEAYRARVRVLRELHEMSQMQWAGFTGIPYKKWNHYERGYPVSRESLFRLRAVIMAHRRFSFSADWLYWGDEKALTTVEVQQIDIALKRLLERRQARKLAPSKPLPTTPVRLRVNKTNKRRRRRT